MKMNITSLLKQSFVAVMTVVFLPAVAVAQERGPQWLEDALFYQIYPSSFMDSNADGIGDLPGITSKLDYIKSLGVNAIWLNPVFQSGWFDGGYDVIDFYKVDPRFGTNTDLVYLIDEAHSRGIKVCLDLVAGHTSVNSQWFVESAQADRNQRYSDYYIWMDDVSEMEKREIALRHQEAHPESSTRGRYVEANKPRARYYEKNFFECQPALNYGFAHPDPSHPWEQPVTAPGPQALRREMRNIMSFWFDKGVDGFRVDMAASLVKNDPDKIEVSKLWHEMREWKERYYPETVLISEWANPKVAISAGFDIDFMIHFGVKGYASLFFARDTPWGAKKTYYDYWYFDRSGKGSISEFVENYSREYSATKGKGYIAIPTANHDFQRPHVADRHTMDQLKVAMTFFLSMPGVPFIYYGDEIGMKYQVGLPSKEGSNERSGSRTPMQWSKGETAGFSTVSPRQLYLPVDTEGGALTVEEQDGVEGSLLEFTRELTTLRHTTRALGNGADWRLLSDVRKAYPMVYERSDGKECCIVVLNPSGKKVTATIPMLDGKYKNLLHTGKVNIGNGKVSAEGVSAAIFIEDSPR